jgi:hypothetical protein
MIRRSLVSLILFFIVIWIMHLLHVRWEPVFALLIFMNFKSSSALWPSLGLGYCILWDHLLVDSFPFFSLAGLIIFGSAIWLRVAFPLLNKPMTVIMTPIYTQFLWFLLLFGYFLKEGSGATSAGYIAPFILGNSIVVLMLVIIFQWIIPIDKMRDFAPRLLA